MCRKTSKNVQYAINIHQVNELLCSFDSKIKMLQLYSRIIYSMFCISLKTDIYVRKDKNSLLTLLGRASQNLVFTNHTSSISMLIPQVFQTLQYLSGLILNSVCFQPPARTKANNLNKTKPKKFSMHTSSFNVLSVSRSQLSETLYSIASCIPFSQSKYGIGMAHVDYVFIQLLDFEICEGGDHVQLYFTCIYHTSLHTAE